MISLRRIKDLAPIPIKCLKIMIGREMFGKLKNTIEKMVILSDEVLYLWR